MPFPCVVLASGSVDVYRRDEIWCHRDGFAPRVVGGLPLQILIACVQFCLSVTLFCFVRGPAIPGAPVVACASAWSADDLPFLLV